MKVNVSCFATKITASGRTDTPDIPRLGQFVRFSPDFATLILIGINCTAGRPTNARPWRCEWVSRGINEFSSFRPSFGHFNGEITASRSDELSLEINVWTPSVELFGYVSPSRS